MKKPWFLKKRIIVSLCIFAAGYAFFTSTAGLKSVITLTQKIIPGTLVIQTIEGSLSHSIRLKNIEYNDKNAHVVIDSLQLDWRPAALFTGKIWAHRFIVNDVQVTLKQQNETKETDSDVSALGWIDYIHIQRANINNFVLANEKQTLVQINQFLLANKLDDSSDISIHSPQGDIQANIRLTCTPFLRWHIVLQSNNLNPGYFSKEWQGKIALALISEGRWSQHNKSFQVSLQNLNGTLRKLPVQGSADIDFKNDILTIKKSNIEILNAKIAAEGKLDQNWDLQWMLNVPNLNTILPESKGKISTSGKITGPRKRPNVVAAVELQQFNYANVMVENIHGNLYSSIMSTALTLNVLGKNIKLADYNFPSIHLLTELQRSERATQVDTAIYTSDKNTLQANLLLHDSFALSGKAHFVFNALNEIVQGPDIKNLGGKLQGNAEFSGKLTRSQINMNASLDNGHVTIPALNTELNDILIKANYRSNQPAKVMGNFKLGQGKTEFTGTADIEKPDLPVLFHIAGNNLQVGHLNEYKITFSPDLTVSYTKQEINVQGKITIPTANITPKDFSNVTTLPNEVIIVDKLKPEPFNLSNNLTMKIEIVLGDQVNLAYQNLQTELKGSLLISKHSNSPPIGTGALYTVRGKYDAYGRSLTIQDGRLIYNGNLLTNPGLEIRAIQKFETVALAEDNSQFNNNQQMVPVYTGSKKLTVGILVKGTLNHPVIALYSDPAGMQQNDILSYLVFGTPRSQLSGTSSLSLLNNLAASLNQHDSGMSVTDITNKIKNTFKLNDFSIGSTEIYDPDKQQSTNTATVNIGKKLGKRISIHYKVGIFTPVSILSLKYKINKRMAFQTEASSLDSGADLLYEIERD